MESSSSKNMTQGAAARALSNTSRTLASDSPNRIVSSSGPLMLMNWLDIQSRWLSQEVSYPSPEGRRIRHPSTGTYHI
ncbi:hypothetical protein P692DRAFT_20910440 [Suillus brevipes Sb2]|nr:hypothetical protein P692DRAFT_20910440 [Suillus brevipes Sb2]